MKFIESLGELGRRLRLLLSSRQRFDREMEEEMRLHRDLRAREIEDAGRSGEEARYAAQRRFGNTLRLREESHAARGWIWADCLAMDVRYSLRRLRKSPGFTVIAVMSLALGIGGNTALFSLMNEVLLKSLPVHRPEELVLFNWLQGEKYMSVSNRGSISVDPVTGRRTSTSISYPAFVRMRDANQVLDGIFAFAPIDQLNVNVDGQSDVAPGQFVTGEYYSTLGVPALLGRILNSADDRAGAQPVAVITWRYWQKRFAGDAGIVGKKVNVNNIPFTIIGIMPPLFLGTLQVGEVPDLTLPMAMEPQINPGPINDLQAGWYWWVRIMGRLKAGVTAAQAQAQLAPAFSQAALDGWQQAMAEPRFQGQLDPRQLSDVPLLRAGSGAQGLRERRAAYTQPVRILFSLLGLVLLIGCVNVGNLLLARATGRSREVAVRLAMGASRARLVRQLLTESVLLSLLAGLVGLLIAYWSKDALLALGHSGQPIDLELPLDRRVLFFTTLVSLMAGILFGLVPALRCTRVNVSPELKQVTGTPARTSSRLVKSLVVTQVALSLVLLTAAGLFARTLWNLNRVSVGFNPDNLLLFRVDPHLSGYKNEQIRALYPRLMARLAALPGVQAVASSRHPLLSFSSRMQAVFTTGKLPDRHGAQINTVSSGFFATYGITILAGRGITDQDDGSAPRVAVINEEMARKYFPDRNPIGQRFWFGDSTEADAFDVVGLARDAKYTDLRNQVEPTVYYSYLQDSPGQQNIAIRTALDPEALIPTVRAAVHEVDSNLPIFDVKTQREYAEESVATERLFARFSSAFGLMALALAAIGLYGTMSYAVTRRIPEIGIRIALGARPAKVLCMVLGETFLLLLAGVALGILAAISAARLAASMFSGLLFGIRAADPTNILLVTVLLGAVAMLAGYLPARRAARIDPMLVLRHE